MSRLLNLVLLLAITVPIIDGQYFGNVNNTNTYFPRDIYTDGIMKFATSISSGMNITNQVKAAFKLLNATSNIIDRMGFNTTFRFLELAQSKNISFLGVDNENLDMIYNVLKFLQFLSTIEDTSSTPPDFEDIITGMGAGLTDVTLPILENVLNNLTLTAGENITAMLTEILGSGPRDLQTFLEQANLTAMNFDPMAMLTGMGVSPLCLQDLGLMMTALTQGSMEAIQMLDSMGKIRAGILEGNTYFPGMYDQCLNIQPSEFSTRYCMIHLPISIQGYSAVLKEGVCVPNTCGENDMLILVNALLSTLPAGDSPLYAYYTTCSLLETTYDTKAIVGLSICGFFVALMIVSTAFDLLRGYFTRNKAAAETKEQKPKTIHDVQAPIPEAKEGDKQGEFPSIIYKINLEEYKASSAAEEGVPKIYPTAPIEETEVPPKQTQVHSDGILVKLLLSFSVWTNGKKLLNAEQGGALGAVNGIRFLSMSWVILGHTYSFSMTFIQNPLSYYTSMLSRWSFMVIMNGLMSVDTFFTMSGLLVAYVVLKEMKKEKGRINWFMFYFHRFWRLTPAYMLILMIDATLSPYLGDGPQWINEGFETKNCAESWWTNLLYVNNFVKTDKLCLGVSWYLANDMQFYVISPLLLVPLYFFRKKGVLVCAVFLLGVTVTTAVISAVNNLPITVADQSGSNDYFNMYYIKPYCRMGPYIVGMITGYFLFEKGLKVKINKYVNFFIWIVATVVACLVVYGIYDAVNGKPIDVGVAALFNSTSRTLWGACISWVIFACATGNGGFVNTILSWKPFIPLGRLTYCAYLCHMIIIYMNLLSARQHLYATDKNFIYLFLGYMVMSYMVAFVLSLAFEAPMMALEKAIFRRGDQKKNIKTRK
ncbi:O-acyltransferase like protein-like [Ylistrum balloti]|uniref:O-acyltransferase like protein-like n=1 Tax=Ylistrum balloti TaxID=509963 RepID=UPI0029059EF5|nr:O-acyltransferase like protein-like [Ylistrum balloti]